MKKYYVILAAAVGLTITSCTSNEYLGEYDPTAQVVEDGSIRFGFDMKKMTRGEIAGQTAAELLGNNFYVTGTKGTEAATSPSPTLVFDNYLVHYGVNTAGTTESNTANWEYVGVTPGTAPTANYVKLSALNSQTIKYWDYSAAQYDFLAFSTGTYKPVASTTPGDGEVGVTAMKYGTDLASSGVAYTFYLPSDNVLSGVYISDITEVKPANYGKEVTLKFKSIGSKVRVALYETVPGYSVKDVYFYTEDGTTDFTDDKGTDAALIAATGGEIATKGQIDVIFPSVGTNNESKGDYDIAAATITAATGTGSKVTFKTFGALTNQLVAPEADEATTGNVYLGRTLPTATFAGDANKQFYSSFFPVSSSSTLTLRVDYTLVPIDGAAETITVKGAKAVVPATYTKWLPNYAYTYIFKISDNTNGWTGDASLNAGLYPITFDAVVAELTDATDQQATITTVATPSITTYQQKHDITKDEYSKATAKNIYVQVMDNSTAPATLKGDLNGTTADATNRSLLYAVTGSTPVSEGTVMDALQNQSSVASGTITGRNGVILTPDANIDATVTSIVNGVDNNPITVTAGQAAEIDIASLAAGTYAYVYDYSTAAKTTTTIYQPIAVTTGSAIGADGVSVTTTVLDAIDTEVAANVTTDGEAVSDTYIYFSKTKNGTSSWTYSFVSVDGKTTLPAGLVKCPVSSLTSVTASTVAADDTIYFISYVRNDGKYAVKIIKIVA